MSLQNFTSMISSALKWANKSELVTPREFSAYQACENKKPGKRQSGRRTRGPRWAAKAVSQVGDTISLAWLVPTEAPASGSVPSKRALSPLQGSSRALSHGPHSLSSVTFAHVFLLFLVHLLLSFTEAAGRNWIFNCRAANLHFSRWKWFAPLIMGTCVHGPKEALVTVLLNHHHHLRLIKMHDVVGKSVFISQNSC